ncbi:MAG: hypothetical protein EA374_05810 [Acholeplasmatales bacterium]|nr:MAG: hypothetical protein EA374_05810 [Acholeplasmatales bacterium]
MKQKIIIEQHGKTLFKGKVMNMPIKQAYIIAKSVELFDDDDPCIIHISYVIQHFVTVLLELFEKADVTVIEAKQHAKTLDFLDVKSLDGLVITLK